jgi:hypothetical protein
LLQDFQEDCGGSEEEEEEGEEEEEDEAEGEQEDEAADMEWEKMRRDRSEKNRVRSAPTYA